MFNAGSNVGAIIAAAVVPLIASRWGWQAPFVMMGVAGLGWLFLWLPFYDDPGRVLRVLFDICGFACLVAFVLNHILARRFDPLDLDETSCGQVG